MNKGLVLYKSKYGAVKKYTAMLKSELPCDICEIGKDKLPDFNPYDWIVFAGGIYAGGISGLHILKKNYKHLASQKLVVFCVGASPYDEKSFTELKVHNFRGDLENIPVFYGRGMWDESKMSWKDRALCKMLQKAVAKKDPSSCEPWMKALLCSAGTACDWTDRSYLIPLLSYLKA